MYEGTEIKIGKKIYPAVFNVVALKEIVKRYGGVEEMGKELEKDYAKAIDEYAWILALLINQGAALQKFESNMGLEPGSVIIITPEQLQLIMKPHEFIRQRDTIYKIINEGMSSGAEAGEEEEDEVLQEILASKNEMGAAE